jgi:hypothetical protein
LARLRERTESETTMTESLPPEQVNDPPCKNLNSFSKRADILSRHYPIGTRTNPPSVDFNPRVPLVPDGRRTLLGMRTDTLDRRFRIGIQHERSVAVTHDTITISPGSRFRAAMVLAIIADALQIVVFPLFVEGALSPADDILDFGIAAVLVHLLGWHWEFLPSFLAKLVPGVDLVPFWTMAVANVYRKSKRIAVTAKDNREQHPALRDPRRS